MIRVRAAAASTDRHHPALLGAFALEATGERNAETAAAADGVGWGLAPSPISVGKDADASA
jgi:hypothetical protein